jgi:hypothetical protein
MLVLPPHMNLIYVSMLHMLHTVFKYKLTQTDHAN